MTKARDLANIISGGFTVSDLPTLTDAQIPNIPASKITSGTFADARIAASNVSQHATSFDDNKIVNDISTLGLRVHTQENLNASNSNSASFDVFQDSSAISNLTDCARSSSEFINTISETIGSNAERDSHFSGNTSRTTPGMPGQHGAANNSLRLFDGQTAQNSGMAYWGGSAYSAKPGTPHQFTTYNYSSNISGVSPMILDFVADSGSTFAIIPGSYLRWYSVNTDGRVNGHYFMYQDTSDVWHFWNGDGRDGVSGSSWTDGTVLNASNSNGWNGIQHPSNGASIGIKRLAMITTSHHTGGNSYPGITELDTNFATYSLTANATGSFTGNNITASSTNKMGAVITYQDFSGTNSLNTDIVLQLSADGGSNYSTATMTALPDFATGIKMAKVNDLSVTAGTSLKYKISFANQASGSKEARIRGVSLQY